MSLIRVERSLRVARTATDCYRYLRDFSTCEQWDPGVDRAEKRTPGLPEPGTQFDLVLRVAGRRVPMQYTLQRVDEARELVLEGQGDGFSVRDHIRFSAGRAGRTRIDYRADMDLRGLPRLLRPLARAWCERIGGISMQGLQAALEADGRIERAGSATLAERLLLPAAADFTSRGYRRMATRGLSRFMDGKCVLITGPTSGLGLATAQLLARLGAELVLVGRGRERLERAAASIEHFAGPSHVQIHEAELSLISDTRRVGEQLARLVPRLDVLINNAGTLPLSRTQTAEGHELALATNLLSPYTLTRTLLGPLQSARGRVINVLSGGLYTQPLRLDDLEFQARPYDGARAYAQAKRAGLSMTQQLARDPGLAEIGFHALHPGWAATPGVARSLPGFNRVMHPLLRDARMGADTAVWLASHPRFDGAAHGGQFWFDRQPRPGAVLPGTGVSVDEQRALMHWLRATCGI